MMAIKKFPFDYEGASQCASLLLPLTTCVSSTTLSNLADDLNEYINNMKSELADDDAPVTSTEWSAELDSLSEWRYLQRRISHPSFSVSMRWKNSYMCSLIACRVVSKQCREPGSVLRRTYTPLAQAVMLCLATDLSAVSPSTCWSMLIALLNKVSLESQYSNKLIAGLLACNGAQLKAENLQSIERIASHILHRDGMQLRSRQKSSRCSDVMRLLEVWLRRVYKGTVFILFCFTIADASIHLKLRAQLQEHIEKKHARIGLQREHSYFSAPSCFLLHVLIDQHTTPASHLNKLLREAYRLYVIFVQCSLCVLRGEWKSQHRVLRDIVDEICSSLIAVLFWLIFFCNSVDICTAA